MSHTKNLFKNVVYFCPYGNHKDQARGNLYEKLKVISENLICFSCPMGGRQAGKAAELIKSSTLVVHWNGSSIASFWVTELCKNFDIPYVIVELGLLPQRDTYIFDKEGICCRSKSLGENKKNKKDDLKDLSKVIFVCQIEFDSTFYHYSNFKNNEEFIDYYVNQFGIDPQNVTVCPHPRNPKIQTKYKISNKKTVDESLDCSLAIGIGSTTMYEIALLGKNVLVVGKDRTNIHPINRHENIKDVERLILKRQLYHSDSPLRAKELILETLKD